MSGLAEPTSVWFLTNGPPLFGPAGLTDPKVELEHKLETFESKSKNEPVIKDSARTKRSTLEKANGSKRKAKDVFERDGKEVSAPSRGEGTQSSATQGKVEEIEVKKVRATRRKDIPKKKKNDEENSPAKAILTEIRNERLRSSRLTKMIVDAATKK